MGSAANEPALKKARTFSVTPLSVDVNGFSNGNGVGGQDQTSGDLDCRRFGTPEGCPYGNKCRFKHGPSDERNIEHPVSALGSKTKPCTKFFSTSGCPYGEGCHFLHYVPGGIAALGLMPLGVSVTPTAPTPTSGMRSALGVFGPTANTPLLASSTNPSVTIGGYKTRLCNKFSTSEGCRFGEKCHFAHGETDLRPSNVRSSCVDYSVLPADRFTSCRWIDTPIVVHWRQIGSQPGMMFAADNTCVVKGPLYIPVQPDGNVLQTAMFGHWYMHEAPFSLDVDIKIINTKIIKYSYNHGAYANGGTTHLLPPVATAIYYGEPTPPGVPGVPASAAAFGLNNGNSKMSIEAVLAGAIIGKAGANVKQISRLTGCKLSIRDHESDASMRNVEMEGTYEQIERATEMVRQFLSYREVPPLRAAAIVSHNYKTKLCENFSQGTCTFADRCHFAHGASELRPLTRL